MLNRSDISKATYGAPKQILANVELQSSVGCIVPQALGTTVGTKKIAKAGTPIYVDLLNLQTAANPVSSGNAYNAVLLHDVDVTTGNANGTALIFGFVNVNRLDADVVAALSSADNASKVTFMKV